MQVRPWTLAAVVVAILSFAAFAAEEPANEAQQAEETQPAQADHEQEVIKACERTCNAADSKCSSDVRRARSQCSRNASTAGRDPFNQYQPNDYGYFCSYFSNPTRCSDGAYRSSCEMRFQHHYYACMDAMRNNIAAMRYDCYRSERDTTDLCREELRQCRAACGG